ncbi:hypothetical protein HU200_016064 [Digitaria exilis]|uniref:Uncharacterized protein n=1 Tax=Digitaria exilis TaxID=1010633 RepID=A0A835KJ11_9POAL|nr:hypothetical protein HU200_016064 [Digitaria exilis]
MQEVYATTIDRAAEEILELLEEDTNASRSISSRNNVFYFNGWDELGASAVLRAIVQRLSPTSPAGKRALAEQEFDQLVHIDCSMWESRRALQRAVVEQLQLPDHVMELFDRQDEEDDFKGVPLGSRAELPQVLREMYQHIHKLNRRFLVIFHNGSNEEIDLASFCGFPLSGYSTNKVLWTFQGRFRLKPRTKVDKTMASIETTDVFVSAVPQDKGEDPQVFWSYLVQQEASEVAALYNINASISCNIDQPEVANCFLYMLELCFSGRHSIDYDLATHTANYWACDGIIQQMQQGDDSLWRAADALQREILLDVDYHQYLPSHLTRCAERKAYLTSPTFGVVLIPTGVIPNGDTFQHFKLNVLKLSRCTFDFQSPPFIYCHSLRFLWLDHCQDTETSTAGAEKEDVHRCFQRLWVLDVRYTDCGQILSAEILDLMTQLRELNVIGSEDHWDIGQLQGRVLNIRKLRVKDSIVICRCSKIDLFSEANKLELLDFSGNICLSPMTRLSGQKVRCLETVIGYELQLKQISFRGCTELKNLILRGSMLVHSLDISGTAVKILDLGTTNIVYLDELYLLGCEKLCAILWPPKDQMRKEGVIPGFRKKTEYISYVCQDQISHI